jgi:tryptophanyl-tRNA synthetase
MKGELVPVGKDNAAHVEVTREIAKRFNYLYGEVFPMPDVLIVMFLLWLEQTDKQK